MNRQQLIKEIEENYQVKDEWSDKEKALQLAIVNNPVTAIDINKVLEILKLEQTQENYSTLESMLNNNINLFWDFVNKFAVSGVHGFLYEYMKYYHYNKQVKEVTNGLVERENITLELKKSINQLINETAVKVSISKAVLVETILICGLKKISGNSDVFFQNLDKNILLLELERLKNEI